MDAAASPIKPHPVTITTTTMAPLQVSHLDARIDSKTHPIFIRTLKEEDAPAFSAIMSDQGNSSDPNVKPMSVEAAEKAIVNMRKSAAVPTVLGEDGRVVSGPGRVNMSLLVKTDDAPEGRMIGLAGYGAIKDWQREGRAIRAGDAGVLVDPRYRGKGYAAEAMKLAIDWAFTPASEGGPQMDLVTITTGSDNAPMVSVADNKLGLKSAGRLGKVSDAKGFEPIPEGTKGEMYYEVTQAYWDEAKGRLA